MSNAPHRLSLELTHLWDKVTGQLARRQSLAKQQFAAALARLGSEDLAIDLGANAGEFTRAMADTGAQVYAFEPDPHALDLLHAHVGGMPNVTIIAAAAGTENTKAKLYRKVGFAHEPDRASKSSSLFAEKSNVSLSSALDVEVIDFTAFLGQLDRPVALMKIDIEGGEVPLMEALLSRQDRLAIQEIYVETHERKLPHLAMRTRALRDNFAARHLPQVNWDWH